MQTYTVNPDAPEEGTDVRLVIIEVTDDLTGETIPAVEECPECFAGPFAGETEATARDNLARHAAQWHPAP